MCENVHGNESVVGVAQGPAALALDTGAGAGDLHGGLVPQFLDWLRSRNYSRATLTCRQQQLRRFAAFLDSVGSRRFQDVTAATIADYGASLRAEQLSANTVEAYLRGVRMFCGWLEQSGRLFENPARFLVLHRRSVTLPKTISVAQMRKLLAAPELSTHQGIRDRALLEVLYATGVRRAELLAMTVFDPDLDNNTVRVMGKGRKERVLPLGKNASSYLQRYLTAGRNRFFVETADPDVVALWLTRSGAPLSAHGLRRIIRERAAQAAIGCQLSTHTIRRSCATHMLANGAHPVTVAAMLGHADVTTLSHYLRVSIHELRNSYRKAKPSS